MVNPTEEDLKRMAEEMLREAKEQEKFSYSGAEMWRDTKKAAVYTSTTLLIILSCFTSGE